MNRIVAVGFDWDGTLIDTLEDKIKNGALVFHEALGADIGKSMRAYQEHSGIPRQDLYNEIALFTIGRNLTKDEYSCLSWQVSARNYFAAKKAEFFPEAISTVKKLREEGRIVYVSSSVPQNELDAVIHTHKIKEFFNERLGSGSRTGNKGIGHTRFIRENYGLDSQPIVFVGDERPDMELAREAGILPIGITNTISREDLIKAGAVDTIQSHYELPYLIRNMEMQNVPL
ncbi:MAG: HAD hydrolase-like protein [Candidatus Woesearchaeota archaeon]